MLFRLQASTVPRGFLHAILSKNQFRLSINEDVLVPQRCACYYANTKDCELIACSSSSIAMAHLPKEIVQIE